MHPAYHSDHPGDCPSCGMRLEPVYADGGDKDAPPDASRLVKVSTERQQMIGVRTGLVEESAGRQAIRTVGRVVADETRVYPIFAATDGWIQEVSDTSTGSMVTKGQRLGSYNSPALVPALQRYFLTMPGGDGPRTFGTTSVESLVQQATDHGVLQHLLDVVGLAPARLVGGRRKLRVGQDDEVPAPPGENLVQEGAVLVRNTHEVSVWIEIRDRPLHAFADPGFVFLDIKASAHQRL